MQLPRKNPYLKLITIFYVLTAWAISVTARAAGPAESAAVKNDSPVVKIPSDEYEIKPGDTLGAIALAHGFSMDDLMETNGIDNPDQVFAGQKLRFPGDPKDGRVTKRGVLLNVPKGFSLSRIADAYDIPLKTLIRANKLTNPDHIRQGQKIFIPGARTVIKLVPPPPCYKDPVTLYRVRNDVTQNVPLCFCNGRPSPKAVEVLSQISGPAGKPVPFLLHPRLAQLLQKIAERFPGKRIEIISGQRVPKQKGHESYHNKGQALDFRVSGVSNKKLVSFVRTFKNVGVGYYPNSVFIHMDTREKKGYWIDYSGQGEKAIYGRANMSKKEIQAIRAKRKQSTTEKIKAEVRSAVNQLTATINKNAKS